MAVPLYDTTSVVVIRLREGRSPFIGDRRHFSHRLVERGLTPPQAVRTIDLVTLAGGLGALLLHQLDKVGAFVVVAQTVCLLGVVAVLELSAPKPDRGQERDGNLGQERGNRPLRERSDVEAKPARPATEARP
jgi:UDP-GlcNAc:undecaprenyl-phosphate GlcNAc-1-phosphate transferase